jgi:hypothetical protein
MFGDVIFASRNARKDEFEFFAIEVGQEAKSPQVHANDRQLVIAHLASSTQDGAVATQHQGQVRIDLAKLGLLQQIKDDDLGMLAKKRQQSDGLLPNTLAAGVPQNHDSSHR